MQCLHWLRHPFNVLHCAASLHHTHTHTHTHTHNARTNTHTRTHTHTTHAHTHTPHTHTQHTHTYTRVYTMMGSWVMFHGCTRSVQCSALPCLFMAAMHPHLVNSSSISAMQRAPLLIHGCHAPTLCVQDDGPLAGFCCTAQWLHHRTVQRE